MKNNENKQKIVKVLKLTPNQKHFCDFIIITAILMGFISLAGNILYITGTIESTLPLWLEICEFILLCFCLIYLIVWKFLRLWHRSIKRQNTSI